MAFCCGWLPKACCWPNGCCGCALLNVGLGGWLLNDGCDGWLLNDCCGSWLPNGCGRPLKDGWDDWLVNIDGFFMGCGAGEALKGCWLLNDCWTDWLLNACSLPPLAGGWLLLKGCWFGPWSWLDCCEGDADSAGAELTLGGGASWAACGWDGVLLLPLLELPWLDPSWFGMSDGGKDTGGGGAGTAKSCSLLSCLLLSVAGPDSTALSASPLPPGLVALSLFALPGAEASFTATPLSSGPVAVVVMLFVLPTFSPSSSDARSFITWESLVLFDEVSMAGGDVAESVLPGAGSDVLVVDVEATSRSFCGCTTSIDVAFPVVSPGLSSTLHALPVEITLERGYTITSTGGLVVLLAAVADAMMVGRGLERVLMGAAGITRVICPFLLPFISALTALVWE